MGVYFWLKPQLGNEERKQSIFGITCRWQRWLKIGPAASKDAERIHTISPHFGCHVNKRARRHQTHQTLGCRARDKYSLFFQLTPCPASGSWWSSPCTGITSSSHIPPMQTQKGTGASWEMSHDRLPLEFTRPTPIPPLAAMRDANLLGLRELALITARGVTKLWPRSFAQLDKCEWLLIKPWHADWEVRQNCRFSFALGLHVAGFSFLCVHV